jgi:16S rRNA processing protein RimM
MINRNDYRSPGKVLRAHGKEGRLMLSVEGSDPFGKEGVSFIFINIDGSFVPFYILGILPATDGRAIVRLEDVDSPEAAAALGGFDYYVHKSHFPAVSGMELKGFAPGEFQVIDKTTGVLGPALEIGGNKVNPLLVVSYRGHELLIPLNARFVTRIDSKKHLIYVDVPEELLMLNA